MSEIQDFRHGLRPTALPQLELTRAPYTHRCKCNEAVTMVLPVGSGVIVWRCKCGKVHRYDFGEAPPSVIQQCGSLQAKRPPIQHKCQDCGLEDWLFIPPGDGELRWSCKCWSV
jgi:hypothetical protein